MKKLHDVVSTYLPSQNIVKENKVTLTDSWSRKYLSKSKQWYMTPMDMIETDNYYLFDRRQPYLKMTQRSVFVGPLFLGGFVFLLWMYVWNQTPEAFILVILAALIGLVVPLGNYAINQGIGNIVVIKKDWIESTDKLDNKTVLKGKVPENNGISFIYFLDKEDRKDLSFIDKLLSLFTSNPLNPLEISFTFTFESVS